MSLVPGTRLGGYEIVSAIGKGGMGEVYRARDTKLGRDIALKILPAAFAADPDRLARFRREAQVLASLNHPNIAHVHGFEDAGAGPGGMHALVMELVEGEDLSARIARGPIPLDEALPIARQIAEALEAAHEHGIIHRDLKPANIKIKDDGAVKVLDFGLAKALDPAGGPRGDAAESPTLTARATELGMILGTAAYMAPEQAKGKPVDRRADVWAFGAVLYEMLTGRRAFEGADVTETLASVIKDTPSFDTLPPNVPAPVRRLLRRCLEKDRTKRLDSIGAARLEILDALDPAHRETASTSSISAPPPAASRRGSWVPWAIAAVSLVVAGGAIAFSVFNRHPPPDAPLQRFEIATPPTNDVVSIALSQDGRQLVFVAKGAQESQLWLRSLDQLTAKPLPDTEGASFPFWAPDGHAIGFFAGGKLKRLDLSGGRPIDLASASAGRGATWSTDNVILFAPTTQAGIFRIAASGGTPVQVTKTSAELGGSHRWPQFLPDNAHFLFYSYQGRQEVKGVYVGSLAGDAPKRLMSADSAAIFAPPHWLLMSRENVLVAWHFDPTTLKIDGDAITIAQEVGDAGVYHGAFSASSTGGILAHRAGTQHRQLTWVDRTGKNVGTIGGPDDSWIASPEISPDGRRIAVFREVRGDNDVYLVEANRALMSRFTFDPSNDSHPSWSADGSQIFFSSGRLGPLDLFSKPSNGAGDEHQVLASPNNKWVTAVSRDGQYLLFRNLDPKTSLDIWALPLKGDGKAFPILQSSFDEVEAQFSPDNQWIAYVSTESGGRAEVFVRPFKGAGGKFQISNGGGTQVRWRNDGKEVFFLAPDGRLMAAPVSLHAGGQLESGAPTPLFMTHLASGSNVTGVKPQYAVSADGRFLMSVALDNASAPPITIEINWAPGKKN